MHVQIISLIKILNNVTFIILNLHRHKKIKLQFCMTHIHIFVYNRYFKKNFIQTVIFL